MPVFAAALIFASCSKTEVLEGVTFPESRVYMPQSSLAVQGPGGNGIYAITPNVQGQTARSSVDAAANKLNIPLGVIRSGVDLDGDVPVNISVNTDTVAKLITAARFPTGTQLLPASAYTVPPSVTVASGGSNASFNMAVDLNFLKANLTQKYAVAVGISSGGGKNVDNRYATTVIYLDAAAALTPAASFTTYIDNATKTVSFLNTSANAVSYSWNYGDGTPAEATVNPLHKYAAAGTYTVTLTATGIPGGAAAAVRTASVIVP